MAESVLSVTLKPASLRASGRKPSSQGPLASAKTTPVRAGRGCLVRAHSTGVSHHPCTWQGLRAGRGEERSRVEDRRLPCARLQAALPGSCDWVDARPPVSRVRVHSAALGEAFSCGSHVGSEDRHQGSCQLLMESWPSWDSC